MRIEDLMLGAPSLAVSQVDLLAPDSVHKLRSQWTAVVDVGLAVPTNDGVVTIQSWRTMRLTLDATLPPILQAEFQVIPDIQPVR